MNVMLIDPRIKPVNLGSDQLSNEQAR